MMVEHASATFAGPSEMTYDQISIDADHFDIVKFDDQSNPEYLIIASRITKLVEKGPNIVNTRFAEYRRRKITEPSIPVLTGSKFYHHRAISVGDTVYPIS